MNSNRWFSSLVPTPFAGLNHTVMHRLWEPDRQLISYEHGDRFCHFEGLRRSNRNLILSGGRTLQCPERLCAKKSCLGQWFWVGWSGSAACCSQPGAAFRRYLGMLRLKPDHG